MDTGNKYHMNDRLGDGVYYLQIIDSETNKVLYEHQRKSLANDNELYRYCVGLNKDYLIYRQAVLDFMFT